MQFYLSALLSAASCLTSAAALPGIKCEDASASKYQAYAETALERLQTWYDENTGLWESYNPSWWQSANALTTLIDIVQIGSSEAQKVADTVIPNTFSAAAAWNIKNKHALKRGENGYINGYYDDMGWWAMAWMRAYDVTSNRTYLETAEVLFEDMTSGWGTNCSTGGLWWDKKQTEIAPIANTLFIEVAAWLANRVQGKEEYYSNWAVKSWDWFNGSTMYLPEQHLVAGGINPTTCALGKDPHDYTYSNGALVSGLVAMARATEKQSYMDEAHLIAAAVMKTMSKNGVLQEPRIDQAHPGEAAPQFKGVFMRGLATLQTQSPKDEYKSFAQKCADSIWENNRNGTALGPDWNGPFYGPNNASPHSSAMDAIVAAWKASV
ncbi:glycoside hydrolase [Xylariales sp. AK1849]|nr:glycoside hydrolase [Xylariales sp. AK1849]